jgi:hypothetical protein
MQKAQIRTESSVWLLTPDRLVYISYFLCAHFPYELSRLRHTYQRIAELIKYMHRVGIME